MKSSIEPGTTLLNTSDKEGKMWNVFKYLRTVNGAKWTRLSIGSAYVNKVIIAVCVTNLNQE